MHKSTREYTRKLLQAQLGVLTHRLDTLDADDAKGITQAVAEIREVANHIADLLTHHLDEPTEPIREVRSALHLYKNVLKSYDAIRDAEISMGVGELANSRPHNLMRDMRKFIETERQWANGEELMIARVVEDLQLPPT
jgi:hypothetical protein